MDDLDISDLPSWTVIAQNAVTELHRARCALSDARDWLRSDWSPGTELTDEQAEARLEALSWIEQAKADLDDLKTRLRDY